MQAVEISASDKARTRAAASSIASGTPSRRATDLGHRGGVVVGDGEIGPGMAGPVGEQLDRLRRPATATAPASSAHRPPRSAHGWSREVSAPARHPARRRPARRWRPAGARSCPAPPASAGREQTAAGCPWWSGRADRAGPSARATVIGTRSGSVIGARSTYHTPSPNSPDMLARDLNRQSGLAHSTGTGQRHQPVLGQRAPAPQSARSSRPTKLVSCDRKMLGNNGFRCPQRREFVDQVGMAQLHHSLGAGQITQARECPDRSATHRRAAGRQPMPRSYPTARSGRRGPDRAVVRCG